MFYLKYAQAHEMAKVVERIHVTTDAKETRIIPDNRLNALLVYAPPQVVKELAKIGITDLKMAAQFVVNTSKGHVFTTSGTAMLNEPYHIEVFGGVSARGTRDDLPGAIHLVVVHILGNARVWGVEHGCT